MKYLKIITFTHKQTELRDLGKLVICNEDLAHRLAGIQQTFEIPELFYVATCNRVAFVMATSQNIDRKFTHKFLLALNTGLENEFLDRMAESAEIYVHEEALRHLLRTSCSLESLVVGEKEILAQMRKAYDHCRMAGLTGDYLRMIMERAVKTAKEVYTHTSIACKPISVVSLAYRRLKQLGACANSRILIIGAGETNNTLSKYLQKHKFSNFSVFNRTLAKAESLAADLGGTAYPLDELKNYRGGFDVIITCTSATQPIITPEVYTFLLNGETSRKTIVDLAVPTDTCPEVPALFPVNFIGVSSLQAESEQNLQDRCCELAHAETIVERNIADFMPLLRQRRVELAMREVPEQIKQIRRNAIDLVFADEVNGLDQQSREVLEKVMNYMEKKYISVPMVMAKEILVNH
ncbi:MAG: glutamyl-tRNA reductase [Mucilaginibacter polytrichastri]|nr:glutamyl-tRNA reductase [Mucilaginibacter polytrichastri]